MVGADGQLGARCGEGGRMKVKAAAEGGKSRSDFLFEIGCEEIPAGMILKASRELKALLQKHFLANGLLDEKFAETSIETFGAPRRLVAIARGVRMRQEDVMREITGPPKSIAYDQVGEPTRAAMSFAEKQGIPVSKLSIINTSKGEYLCAKQLVIGRPAVQILGEVLPQVIQEISWPRSMYWTGAHGPRFIRPIRWIVALLEGKVIPFSFAGVPSGSHTDGHRFLGKKYIPIKSPADYEEKLKKNFVLCRPAEREAKIATEIRALTSRGGLRTHEDAELLELVAYLNEYPSVIVGDFDAAYLALPDEILLTVMRDHQKYFGLESRNGELAPHFLAVINLPKDPKGLVRAGHERVLRARFADAQFFWETDQKIRLGDYLPKLAAITYERRLGSYRDKVERMRNLARWFAEQWFSGGVSQADVAGSDRAAELAKCDLVTKMVREFPELQGIVGGLYARAQGEPDEVADAIYDHYRPVGLTDPIPRNVTGCAVALADKLDSIAGCFTVGVVPTGSSDPYALRRAALGIVKIIMEKKLPVSLSLAVGAAAKALLVHKPKKGMTTEQETQVLEFILERARFILRDRDGFAYDEVNAVFRAGAKDLVDAQKRLVALKTISKSKNFEPLAVSFKRVRKILEKAELGKTEGRRVQVELFDHDAERELYAAMREAAARVQTAKRGGRYQEALEIIAGLRKAIDRFFEDVMVMAEDERIRSNRLTLLSELLKEFTTVADFSEIGAEEHR